MGETDSLARKLRHRGHGVPRRESLRMNLLNSILSQADESFAKDDLPAARECLRLAARIAPRQPEILATLGNLHFLLDDFRGACRAFSGALRRSPDDTELLVRLAMSHRMLGQHAATEMALRRALEVQADDFMTLKLLADCYREQKRHREAAELYLQLLDRQPQQVEILLSLAKLSFDTGDRDSAAAVLKTALVVDPANAIAKANLATLQAGAPAIHFRRGVLGDAAHAHRCARVSGPRRRISVRFRAQRHGGRGRR
jgi:tetratricopeptide (TPR) repeat protein